MDKQNILLMATILCLLICNSSPVAATNGDEYLPSYGGPEEPKGIEPVQILVRLVFSLIIVVALFYISARFLKSRWANSRTAEHMAILDRLSLGPNQNIFIIRLGKDYLVLGVTGDNISLLQRIEDGDLLARLEIEHNVGEGTFEKILSRQGEGKFLSLKTLETYLGGIRNKVDGKEESPPGGEQNP
ncbi:MAG: flagellar biosynthetic protein FliO [Firmicutes bacterium]|nr:flagellar biosynthetic protein FliO [Bacillota bacterium]